MSYRSYRRIPVCPLDRLAGHATSLAIATLLCLPHAALAQARGDDWSQALSDAGDFSLSLAPPQRTIVQGGWQDFAVQITRTNGFTGAVSLKLTGAPSGVTGAFNRNPVLTGSTKLTVNVASTVPPGSYTFFVHGDARTSADVPLTLTVAAPLPAPTVSVDSTLRSDITSLPGPDPAHPRVVVCLADDKHKTHFVADELIVSTSDSARLSAFLTRWHGTLVNSVGGGTGGIPSLPPIKLVHIDPSAADVTGLPAHMQKANPNVTGSLRFSDAEGMRLFAAAAEEAAGGLTIGLNFVGQPDSDFLNGVSTEAPSGVGELNGSPYSPNVFNWSFMKQVAPSGFGVTHAWQALDFAGKLGNKTMAAIVEQGGYGPNADFPGFVAMSTIPGVAGLGVPDPVPNSQGKPAPWHGTFVAEALAGIADNGFGAAGPAGAGPNADLLLVTATCDILGMGVGVAQAANSNARIVNMSCAGSVPALAALSIPIVLNLITDGARSQGVLIFASAGNHSEDVDEEDCFMGVCWETTWWWACENDGVICVGGLDHDSRDRAPGSNYSSGHVGDVNTVDIWGPFDVLVAPDPDHASNFATRVSGTSFSSPYVAGVAALVWAANPLLTADQVESILYSSAGVSFDLSVNTNRIVLADLAVMSALGDMPPKVSITTPSNNAQVGYGGLNTVTFKASAVDFEDGAKCCKLTWTSSVDGPLGSGPTVNFEFPTPGLRKITVEATDIHSNKTSASIFVNATNSPPTVKILKPSPGASVIQNVVTIFSGQGSDPNEVGFTLPCANLTWTTDVPGDQQLTGCQPAFKFTTVGPRTIRLVGKDSQGQPSSPATVNINVVPTGPGPYVTITSPLDNSLFAPGAASGLSFSLTGATGFYSYQWKVKQGPIEVPIKVYPPKIPGTPPYWIPSDYLAPACGTSSGTLGIYINGNAASDHVQVSVSYPVC